jgi:hypothetical protein
LTITMMEKTLNNLPEQIYAISEEVIKLIKLRMRELPENAIEEHLVPMVGNLVGNIAIVMFREVALCSNDAQAMYLRLCERLNEGMIEYDVTKTENNHE